jgi:hypothetical protein
MPDKIINCPCCKTLLLGTVEACPRCGYALERIFPKLETVQKPADDEVVCPGCNELVLKGLIRCWNCGTFLKSKLP